MHSVMPEEKPCNKDADISDVLVSPFISQLIEQGHPHQAVLAGSRKRYVATKINWAQCQDLSSLLSQALNQFESAVLAACMCDMLLLELSPSFKPSPIAAVECNIFACIIAHSPAVNVKTNSQSKATCTIAHLYDEVLEARPITSL